MMSLLMLLLLPLLMMHHPSRAVDVTVRLLISLVLGTKVLVAAATKAPAKKKTKVDGSQSPSKGRAAKKKKRTPLLPRRRRTWWALSLTSPFTKGKGVQRGLLLNL
jgi:hypothetical protein